MKLAVILTESALADLQNIQQYYLDEKMPHVAERQLEAIFAKLEYLTEHPDMGRIVPEFNTKTLRELIHSPYRIIYWRTASSIKVIRIWRSERKLYLPDDINLN